MPKRLLVPAAALLWGLQFAFLNPALALLLVSLFHADAAEVGWILAAYNAAGFAASLVLPAYADRTRDYLRPMLGCAALTIALAVVLALTASVPLAVAGLLALGGPAGVGSSLLFAQLKHAGASRADVVNTRALISFAWVAGPPLASFLIGAFGGRSILYAIGAVALLNIATTLAMIAEGDVPVREGSAGDATGADDQQVSRAGVVLVVGAFIALQATNSAVVSVMGLFVTHSLGLPVYWSGVALAVSAAAEVPVLLLLGRLGQRFADLTLIVGGCLAGLAYYLSMVFVSGPVALVVLQLLNASFFAVIAGVGLTLFQRIIARPGLASGLYTNTRRLGAIVSGPLIGLAGVTSLGYGATFAACAGLTAAAAVTVGAASRISRRERPASAATPSPVGSATPR